MAASATIIAREDPNIQVEKVGVTAMIVLPLTLAELAWLMLAVVIAISLISHVLMLRKLRQLRIRVDRFNRSISHIDSWADDVDIRLANLEAQRDVKNDNSSTRPFLESFLGSSSKSADQEITPARVRTIITNMKSRNPTSSGNEPNR